MQKTYNKKVLTPKSLSGFSAEEKDRHTQELALCTHAEISSLINATNFKKHHGSLEPLDTSKITYESVDVIRYILAILNLWDVDADTFEHAFSQKDLYLHTRKRIDDKPWVGQPVIIFDIDDVLAEFRSGFCKWLGDNKNIYPDIESPEYYFIDAIKSSGINPEAIFRDFVNEHGFARHLSTVDNAVKVTRELKRRGYWLHMLTARPEEDLICFYDTYQWLNEMGIHFDDLSFSSEKFRWCAQSKYYDSDSIEFAVDDSPKHAADYALHGIKCLVPKKSYNKNIWDDDNIKTYDNIIELLDHAE